ncbi:MAG TPA: hypothetical protein VGW75_15210 [Solirubrobacteraceae bacterium]|nr:hypothetical protein [Solirubrobacteraceae bacterium]
METIGALTQPVAAVAALLAVVFAARSSRAAQRTLVAPTRPLLTDVPRARGQPRQEVDLPDGSREVGQGEIVEHAGDAWLSVPVRNVGRGMAIVDACRAEILTADVELSSGSVARPQVEPDAETRLPVWVGRASEHFPTLREAIARGAGIVARLAYTDIAGDQRQVLSMQLARRSAGPWYVEHRWTREVRRGMG